MVFSFKRCLEERALLQDARRKELTLPPNPSWQSRDSEEKASQNTH